MKRTHIIHHGGYATKWIAENYRQYLRTEHWRIVRSCYRAHRPWTCWICRTDKNIQLHHRTYASLGRERLIDLVALCRFHHTQVHKEFNRRKKRAPKGQYRQKTRGLLWKVTKYVHRKYRREWRKARSRGSDLSLHDFCQQPLAKAIHSNKKQRGGKQQRRCNEKSDPPSPKPILPEVEFDPASALDDGKERDEQQQAIHDAFRDVLKELGKDVG